MGNGVVGGLTNVASVLALALLNKALNLPPERCPSLSMLLGKSVKTSSDDGLADPSDGSCPNSAEPISRRDAPPIAPGPFPPGNADPKVLVKLRQRVAPSAIAQAHWCGPPDLHELSARTAVNG